MKISGSSRQRGLGLFPAGFEGEVLNLVIEVWAKLELPRSARIEPRITKLLVKALRQRYQDEQRDGFVTPEEPDSDESGKETSRTDIRVYPPRQHLDVHFVLEAKRLNTPASNASAYVGSGGVMCFIAPEPHTGRPKYSSGMPCGAMLGYVMDAKVPRAHDAICKAVRDKRESLKLTTDGDYRSSPLLPGEPHHGETRHSLPDGLFILYHLLLPVRWESSRSRRRAQ
jgi:hypothetical protein